MDAISGIKLNTCQVFTQDGVRIPVTTIKTQLTPDLKPGDLVKVTGISKGKGFAGGVKRWGFKGGPKTHGQSDRQRAPGSIGQTTTPGRIYKGKKMAGHTGNVRVTISGLTLMEVDEKNNLLLVKGLIPGRKKGKVTVKKYGLSKKFKPLLGPDPQPIEEKTELVAQKEENK